MDGYYNGKWTTNKAHYLRFYSIRSDSVWLPGWGGHGETSSRLVGCSPPPPPPPQSIHSFHPAVESPHPFFYITHTHKKNFMSNGRARLIIRSQRKSNYSPKQTIHSAAACSFFFCSVFSPRPTPRPPQLAGETNGRGVVFAHVCIIQQRLKENGS
jgi:hypothetical protein